MSLSQTNTFSYLDKLRITSRENLLENDDIKIFGDCSMLPFNRKIAEGTYGEIYTTSLPNVVIKKSKHPNYNNELVKEAKIMMILNSPLFPTCYGVFKCDDGSVYIALEKVDGSSYTNWVSKNKYIESFNKIKEFLLCKILYYLSIVQEEYKFTHNDLIGQNIMIYEVPREIQEFGDVEIDNMGYDVKLVDFGFSRLDYNGIELYNETVSQRYYNGEIVPFIASADICKLLGNPNLQTPRIVNTDFYKEEIKPKCKYSGSFAVIPPFPDFNAKDAFIGLFGSLINPTTNTTKKIKLFGGTIIDDLVYF